MLKRKTMLAMATVAVAALAVPATASANWQHGQGLMQKDSTIELATQFIFQTELGGLECGVWTHIDLLANQTTATVTNFAVNLFKGGTVTDTCSVDSTLTFLGCIDVAQLTVDIGSQFHWIAHGTGTRSIDVTTKTMQFHLHGGIFCPKTIQLTPGTLKIVPANDLFAASQLQGGVEAHVQGMETPTIVSGEGNVTPASTFGVK